MKQFIVFAMKAQACIFGGLILFVLWTITIGFGDGKSGLNCSTNWTKCIDNADLVNNWHGYSDVQVSCKDAANNRAKYGDPQWPWLAFGTFLRGNDYPRTGIVTAIEDNARFANGFNAKLRTSVTCTYDLNASKVIRVAIS